MPIINVKFIEGVVGTDEQKRELIDKLTETFVSICGEVTRPFVYCLIEETKPYHWGIAGKPMPDLAFLTGEEYAANMKKADEIMSAQIAQQSSAGSQNSKR